MSARPVPRRSSLAGSNPITPPQDLAVARQEKQAPPAASAPAVRSANGVPQEGSVQEVQKRPARKTKYPPKVSFYQDAEDTNRVRGAILHTMALEGPKSLSQFIHQAVMAEVERLEEKYNEGRPFGPVGPRELPQGRQMGE